MNFNQTFKFAVCFVAALGVLQAQSFTASVRGTVTDASGAAVPGARVVVTSVERGTPSTTTSDEAGRFAVTALQPGNYTLFVEAQGFNRFSSGQFTLTVQQQATVDAQLQVGDVSTTVEVTGSAAMVNTTIANLGQVIENKYIISLPNIARNPMGLTYLTPGVVGSGGRPGDSNTNFVANGARNSTSEVLLDGATVTAVEQNSGVTDLKFSPSVDVVQEFKMQTNFFSAEYGQTGSAVVNMVTKSGSNDFHGTGYYFLRHSDVNANNWFSNRAGRARPYYRRDQFGGILTGPIVRNKTFFMTSYEYTKAKSPVTEQVSFPTMLQRTGDFSQTRNTSGAVMNIYNPFDTFTNANGAIERRPFPGNMIPRSMMDPVALKAVPFFPTPNQAGAPFTETNNWYQEGINLSPSHQMNHRGDHSFNDNNRLSARWSMGRSEGKPPNLFGEGNPAHAFNRGPTRNIVHSLVTDYTRTENPTTLWTLRYGYTFADFFRNPMENFDLTTLGFPQYMKQQATFDVFPAFSPDGFRRIGAEGWLIMDRQEGIHHFSWSMNKMIGGHNTKFGLEHRRNRLDYAQPGFPAGNFNFARSVTCRDRFSCPGNEGNGFATMLLGWSTYNDFHIDPKVFSRSAYWGFYFQDDWKVTRKLTLNLGIRYDFDVPRWEELNRQSYWDLEAQSPIRVQGFDTRGVFRFVDNSRRSPFDADMNNFQPRVGFAYAMNSKTAIRGGFGLFYTLSRATVFGHTGSGFVVNSNAIWSLDSNATRYATLSNPWVDGMLLPPGNSLGENTFIGLGAGTILGSNNRNPELYSWNYSIQRELPFKSVLEVNYTGSRGVHLFVPFTSLTPIHPNVWNLGRTALNSLVPNPFHGVITDPRSQLSRPTVQMFRLLRNMPHFDGANVGTAEPPYGNSHYHALQAKWEKRYSKGLTLLTHYTWGKMIDDISHSSGNVNWLGGGTNIQNPFDMRGERSLSSHDVAHRAVFTWAYELPFGRGRQFGSNWAKPLDWIAGGWEVSGFGSMQSGMPLHVTQAGGNIWNGSQRPNLVGDPSTSGRVQDRLNKWYNESAFTQPPVDVPGTAPRTLRYRGPGIKALDMSINKSIVTKEGQRAEIRLEAQNAFNHPIFSDPASSFGSTNFGQITGVKIGPRNVQLGFKYYW